MGLRLLSARQLGRPTALLSSGQQCSGNLSVNVRKTEVAAGVAEGQLLVIETHDVQDRGVEIVNVNGVLSDFVADVVGLAVDDSGLHSATR